MLFRVFWNWLIIDQTWSPPGTCEMIWAVACSVWGLTFWSMASMTGLGIIPSYGWSHMSQKSGLLLPCDDDDDDDWRRIKMGSPLGAASTFSTLAPGGGHSS